MGAKTRADELVEGDRVALQFGGERRAELAAALDVGVERARVALAIECARALPPGEPLLAPPLLAFLVHAHRLPLFLAFRSSAAIALSSRSRT